LCWFDASLSYLPFQRLNITRTSVGIQKENKKVETKNLFESPKKKLSTGEEVESSVDRENGGECWFDGSVLNFVEVEGEM
jgi:hypothetical protein